MKNFIIILSYLLAAYTVLGQTKKEAKANKIKSTTVWQADNSNGTAVTYKESYEEFDKDGRTTMKVEYDKDGTIKRKETAKYYAFGNKTEETLYDLKDSKNEKKIYKYSGCNDTCMFIRRESGIKYIGILLL